MVGTLTSIIWCLTNVFTMLRLPLMIQEGGLPPFVPPTLTGTWGHPSAWSTGIVEHLQAFVLRLLPSRWLEAREARRTACIFPGWGVPTLEGHAHFGANTNLANCGNLIQGYEVSMGTLLLCMGPCFIKLRRIKERALTVTGPPIWTLAVSGFPIYWGYLFRQNARH